MAEESEGAEAGRVREAQVHEGRATGDAAFVLALRERGVRDTAVLRAMERVPRAAFVPAEYRAQARRDIALPLPCGQTMTAPTLVATMLVALGVPVGARVLEIGTGSGYVAALLAQIAEGASVLSFERYARLARGARTALDEVGTENVRVEFGDGLGFGKSRPGQGLFDRILLNGSVPALPEILLAALAPEGRLVGARSDGSDTRLVSVSRGADGALTGVEGRLLRLAPLAFGRARAL